ncbi:MAG: hypothetical protein PXY39_11915 [archaeon]|nr:hypothetical protein [archaeon]
MVISALRTNATTTENSIISPCVLRLTPFVAVISLLNFCLLMVHESLPYSLIANAVASSVVIFLSSTIGNYLDKKVAYAMLLLYNRLAKAGLLEEEGLAESAI